LFRRIVPEPTRRWRPDSTAGGLVERPKAAPTLAPLSGYRLLNEATLLGKHIEIRSGI